MHEKNHESPWYRTPVFYTAMQSKRLSKLVGLNFFTCLAKVNWQERMEYRFILHFWSLLFEAFSHFSLSGDYAGFFNFVFYPFAAHQCQPPFYIYMPCRANSPLLILKCVAWMHNLDKIEITLLCYFLVTLSLHYARNMHINYKVDL